jgi:threonine/homoserine/homoserine lactone efflux protein
VSLAAFVRGFVVGLSIAAPVGPIGVLCIRRSLAAGRLVGFVSGLGAATADAAYGCIAAFGLTAVSAVLVSQRLWLQVIGGAFLCYLGVRTLTAVPAAEAAHADRGPQRSLLGAYASTLFLTLTNPLTILSFAAIFAGLGLGVRAADYRSAASMVLGVFVGSATWWLLLSGGAAALRARVTTSGLRWVNRVSGAVIVAFGLVALMAAVRRVP